jgi:hypothetical protein
LVDGTTKSSGAYVVSPYDSAGKLVDLRDWPGRAQAVGLSLARSVGKRVRVARVVELVDALDSKSSTERCVGSSPTSGTIPSRLIVDYFPDREILGLLMAFGRGLPRSG